MIFAEKNFKLEQFKFLSNKNFNFFAFKKKQSINKNSNYNVDLILASQKTAPRIKNFYLVFQIKSQEDFLRHITQNPILVDQKQEEINFCLDFLYKNLSLQKTILTHHQSCIHNFQLKDYFKYFLNNKYFNTITSFNKYFSKTFTNSFWSIHSIELKEMHNSLLAKWGNKDTFKFWLFFFKKRKNQINNPKNSLFVYQFLNSIYKNEQDKLLKFANFFKYLRSKFEEPIINFFEKETQYSIHIYLNLEKMIYSFFIDNYSTSDYYEKLQILSNSIVQYFSLNGFELLKKRNVVKISFNQNGNILKEEELHDIIVCFFKNLKETLVNIKEESQIINWLHFYFLNKNISQNYSNNQIIKI